MECEGSVTLVCVVEHTKKSSNVTFLVSRDLKHEILLSYADLSVLKVLPSDFPFAVCNKISQPRTETDIRNDLISKFRSTISDELPKEPMKCPPMTIELKEGPVRPLQLTRSRPVALHHQKKAYKLLTDLEAATIIFPMDEPTDWVSPAMFVEKANGELRLVTDYTALNKYIRRPIHPFMSAQDTIRQISPEAKYFCTLDAVSGYFQVALDAHASKLTTFLTPWGKKAYARGPQGCCSTQDYWNLYSDAIIADFQAWCAKIVDDILIWAATLEELFERVSKILQKCTELRVTISEKKLQIGTSVKFAGYVISQTGITPDPEKVSAIRDFPAPTDVSGLRSFLGLANQLGSFLPDLSQATSHLRTLLKKGTAFVWTADIQIQFEKAKEILCSPMCVKPFDPTLKTSVLTDASCLHGLGYILLQWSEDGNPRIIQCGSFALTPAQKNYAVIELEMLSIVRAVEKCRFYLQGADDFEIITDHKPLVGIMGKLINEIYNARLSKFRQRLSPYNSSITWTAGKIHFAADALSRYPVFAAQEEEGDDDAFASIRHITICTDSDTRINALASTASEDAHYQQIVSTLENNNLANLKDPNHPAKSMKSNWDSLAVLTTEDGKLITMGDRLYIPIASRPKILAELHKTHQGSVKTKLAAREAYFWPGMNNEIANLLDNCETCQMFRPSQPHESQQHYIDALERPMQLWSGDLFQWAGKTYLLLVDGYSGYIFVDELRKTSTKDIINVLVKYFNIFGYPESFLSDNGPQFRTEMKEFLESRGIRPITSSPYFPSSNGHAESGVKSAKHLLKKCMEEKSNFEAALAELRRQPRTDGFIPSELFLNRGIKGDSVKLPRVNPRKEPGQQIPTTPKNTANDLHELTVGQLVRVQNEKTQRWERKARITEKCDFGRSYELQDIDDSAIFRRNRVLLRPITSDDRNKASPEEDKNLNKTDADETIEISSPSPVQPRRSPRNHVPHQTRR